MCSSMSSPKSAARQVPELYLVKIGCSWTPAQQDQLTRLGISGRIISLGFVNRHAIAAAYRRAAIVMVPSDAEGFGLPVAEARLRRVRAGE